MFLYASTLLSYSLPRANPARTFCCTIKLALMLVTNHNVMRTKRGNRFYLFIGNYLALVLFSHIPKVLFSVSRHIAKYPILGTGDLGIITLPPSF